MMNMWICTKIASNSRFHFSFTKITKINMDFDSQTASQQRRQGGRSVPIFGIGTYFSANFISVIGKVIMSVCACMCSSCVGCVLCLFYTILNFAVKMIVGIRQLNAGWTFHFHIHRNWCIFNSIFKFIFRFHSVFTFMLFVCNVASRLLIRAVNVNMIWHVCLDSHIHSHCMLADLRMDENLSINAENHENIYSLVRCWNASNNFLAICICNALHFLGVKSRNLDKFLARSCDLHQYTSTAKLFPIWKFSNKKFHFTFTDNEQITFCFHENCE